jgi:hypothetical protein
LQVAVEIQTKASAEAARLEVVNKFAMNGDTRPQDADDAAL